LWENFGRNLHFLTNEKWHFWWQNPSERNHTLQQLWFGGMCAGSRQLLQAAAG